MCMYAAAKLAIWCCMYKKSTMIQMLIVTSLEELIVKAGVGVHQLPVSVRANQSAGEATCLRGELPNGMALSL